MILQNLTKAIREQNYYAVVLEFLIVIAGVVIGFQITAWNEARTDRQDEALYLMRIHDDVLLAEQFSSRVRARSLENPTALQDALRTIRGESEIDELTQAECDALGSTGSYFFNVTGLASYEELSSGGRLNIMTNDDLRQDLVEYEQLVSALLYRVAVLTTNIQPIFDDPEALRSVSWDDPESTEVRIRYQCDLLAIRSNAKLVSQLNLAADLADAYFRDVLLPWSVKLDSLHQRLDAQLGIEHEA